MNKIFSRQFVYAALLATGLPSMAAANTYWLNIPGSYSAEEGRYMPSVSFPTSDHYACSDAIVQYAKDNLVNYIGCDVKPLPDAVNLPASVRR